ncbi:MAG TPA: carboxypeptidase-like regulatory domain-containing protein, partial [Kofleriaceae bacterium]|nr:carboxypeptidase-like regulatory domain-containing protein [Kofleriaceae bacterium]
FELRLPAGTYELDVGHPRFAGVASISDSRLVVPAGDHLQTTITLIAGCIIAGRVVGPEGKPAGDGAIEKQWGEGAADYTPAGRIDPDGAFRWVTTDEGDVSLRAWPWKAPPSATRRFACRDGARFDDVVFQLPERRPDIEGVLVDKAGEPVGFAFVDLAPLDRGGIAQQERTDAAGHWQVFSMPPGRYRASAHAEGRGVAIQTIVSPRDGVRLELGGTGRLEGTTTRLTSGSFELIIGTCVDGAGMVPLPQARRLVTVSGGRFTVDDLPACELSFGVSWRGRMAPQHLAIPSGGTAHIELDLGTARAKTVHGLVRDASGAPIAGAIVTSSYEGKADTIARTDASGAYTLKSYSGAALRARAPGRVGTAQVGGANLDAEQVDLIIVVDGRDDDTDD